MPSWWGRGGGQANAEGVRLLCCRWSTALIIFGLCRDRRLKLAKLVVEILKQRPHLASRPPSVGWPCACICRPTRHSHFPVTEIPFGVDQDGVLLGGLR